MDQIHKLGALLAILTALCGCAGPSTPFGGRSLSELFELSVTTFSSTLASKSQNATSTKIHFSPPRQVLHDRTQWAVTIQDASGIRNDHQLTVLYNDVDVTQSFLKAAKVEPQGETRVRYTLVDFRLLAERENRIKVIYRRSPSDVEPVSDFFLEPQCSAFVPAPFVTTGDFEIAGRYVNLVNDLSMDSGINPTFMAGLIAQESGFNDLAVSWQKAIGLTQVTPPGEAEIINKFKTWPRFPNLNDMAAPLAKLKILTGKINGTNEWRLDPELSIRGGIAYLRYINDYWHRPENYILVKYLYSNPDAALTSLLLASYNSGPFRVNLALHQFGQRWLTEDKELLEARRYVNRVKSYCDYFSRREDDNGSAP